MRTRKIAVLAAAFALLGMLPPAAADEASFSQGILWMKSRLNQVGIGIKTKQIEQQLLAIFDATDVDGSGGVSKSDYQMLKDEHAASTRGFIAAQLLSYDLNGDGVVSTAEVEPRVRGRLYASFQSRSSDERPFDQKQFDKQLANEIASVMEADANKDGKITFDEMLQSARAFIERQASANEAREMADRSLVPLSLDRDGDGTVQLAEYRAAIEAVLKDLGKDGDGTLSEAEVKAAEADAQKAAKEAEDIAREKARIEEMRRVKAACALPPVPSGAKVVLIGTGGGKGNSTATLVDATTETEVADLVIENGSEPLYIAALSQEPVIWRLRGQTDRVAAMILATASNSADDSKWPLAGVVGLDAAKLYYTARKDDCLVYIDKVAKREKSEQTEKDKQDKQDKQDAQSKAQFYLDWIARSKLKRKSLFEETHGIKVDVFVDTMSPYIYKSEPPSAWFIDDFSSLKIPSGISDKSELAGAGPAPKKPDALLLWQRARKRFPGGFVEIDPSTVAAKVPVVKADVFDQESGFASLIEDGTLIPVEWKHGYRDNGSVSITGSHAQYIGQPGYIRVPYGFRVTRKMRVPTHAAIFSMGPINFYVPDGVPVPDVKGESNRAGVCIHKDDGGKEHAFIKGDQPGCPYHWIPEEAYAGPGTEKPPPMILDP